MSAEMTREMINAIAMVIGIILTAYIIPWIKQRVDADKLAKIKEYTEIAVRCAEQIYSREEGALKKQYVFDYILKKANDIGIGMDEADIELLIEGIVNEVKYGGGNE